MPVIVYRGPAGTGKTWSLVERLRMEIAAREWKDFEAVLGVTFMHGARRRLDKKLAEVCRHSRIKLKCLTIDSFIVNLVNKFRSYLGDDRKISVNANLEFPVPVVISDDEVSLPLATIQEYAVQLLSNPSVKQYVTNSYPIIVIDEFQDCVGNLLEVVKGLSGSTLVIAMDPFQQLQKTEELDADRWIGQGTFEVNDLLVQRRTRVTRLVNTAACLREGVNIKGNKVYVQACPGTKNVASSFVTKSIYYALSSRTDSSIAIIVPSRGRFVNGALEGLGKGYPLNGVIVGPYGHLIGEYKKTDIKEIAADYVGRDVTREELYDMCHHSNFVCRRTAESALNKVMLRNAEHIGAEEFMSILGENAHAFDNYIRRESESRIVFSTIHSAKNREFDHVIILWPYEVTGDVLYKRKLLYNAVTRAKVSAAIFVQHKTFDTNELGDHPVIRLIL